MGKDEGGLIVALAALLLGGLGLLLIAASSEPKCPNCKKTIERNTKRCPHCKVELKW